MHAGRGSRIGRSCARLTLTSTLGTPCFPRTGDGLAHHAVRQRSNIRRRRPCIDVQFLATPPNAVGILRSSPSRELSLDQRLRSADLHWPGRELGTGPGRPRKLREGGPWSGWRPAARRQAKWSGLNGDRGQDGCAMKKSRDTSRPAIDRMIATRGRRSGAVRVPRFL